MDVNVFRDTNTRNALVNVVNVVLSLVLRVISECCDWNKNWFIGTIRDLACHTLVSVNKVHLFQTQLFCLLCELPPPPPPPLRFNSRYCLICDIWIHSEQK